MPVVDSVQCIARISSKPWKRWTGWDSDPLEFGTLQWVPFS